MRTTTHLSAAALSTMLVIGATATSAFAQSDTITDMASDVISYANAAGERGAVLNYADSVASGIDVKTIRVKHTQKSISVNLRFRNLDQGFFADAATRYAVDGVSATSFRGQSWTKWLRPS